MKKMVACILCCIFLTSCGNADREDATQMQIEKPLVSVMPTEMQRQAIEPAETPQATETPKPKKVKKKVKKVKVSEKDIYRLAQVIIAENGSCKDDDCLILTGIVVMKRVKSSSYPNTITGVISQNGQYSTYPALLHEKPSSRCLEIAEEILRGNLQKDYPDRLVFQAEFKQGTVYRKIGNEYFCMTK